MKKEKKVKKEIEGVEIQDSRELQEKLEKAIKSNPNKPTEEETKQAEIEFDERRKRFESTLWEIGAPERAKDYTGFLLHYLRNRVFWSKNGWMGVIKLIQEIEEAEKVIKDEPLKIGYQALEFTFYALSNPAGIGLQSAKDFESDFREFVEVFDAVSVTIEKAREELKEIQFLQDRYAAMMQGFYLEREDAPIVDEEEKPEETQNP